MADGYARDKGKLKETEDSMISAQIAPNAVVARNPDFCKLAQAFGAKAKAPQTLATLQPVVQDAFSSEGPALNRMTPQFAILSLNDNPNTPAG